MLLLDVLGGLSPELWAALFWGVFVLLLIAVRREDKDREDQ